MTDIRATIVAAALAEHARDGTDLSLGEGCACGWFGQEWVAHQAAAVLAALTREDVQP